MRRVLIFGGTTEGRELAEFCAENGVSACVSVATAYGASLLRGVGVFIGRLTRAEMLKLIDENGFELVVDATHPFASEATANIRAACGEAGVRLVRVLREDGGRTFGRYFDEIRDLISFLSQTDGGVLITTGSKELAAFCALENYGERCAVRVLPSAVERCLELGFAPERIIAGKGPFTREQNVEHIKKFNARFLVTKDSGKAGGLGEKLAAAKELGAAPLILKRPRESGLSLAEVKQIVLETGEAHE